MRLPWNRMESDLNRELSHHLHHLAADYERQGYSHDEALQMAKREFGAAELYKEQCRDQRRCAGLPLAWMSGLCQDVVFAVRIMRKTPVITLAAILSLSLSASAPTSPSFL